jgi:hypothetical protein
MRRRRKNLGIFKEFFIVTFFLFVFPHLSYGAGMADMTPSSAGDFDMPVFFNLLPVATQPGNFATGNTSLNNSLASITGTPWSGNFLHSSLGFGGGFGLAYWITNRIAVRGLFQVDSFGNDGSTSSGADSASFSGNLYSFPLTAGILGKIYEDKKANVMLYATADAGIAIEDYSGASTTVSVPGGSTSIACPSCDKTGVYGYFDGGFGVNFPYHTFAEIKVAYQNWAGGFISVPVSFGVNF